MASIARTQFALVLVAFLVLGCGRKDDSKLINIRDFDSGVVLSDTLKRLVPPGTRLSVARALMEKNGFQCDQRAGIVVDQKAGKIGSGKPHLECWKSSRIFPGIQHRDWTVTYRYDSSGVRDVFAGYIIQP